MRLIGSKIVITVLTFLFATNIVAAPNTNIGPALNQQAPQITVINTEQVPVSIAQLSSDNGLIILFFRSADWCPYCKKHLIELNEQAEKFAQLGYGLAGISYDKTNILAGFTQKQQITYPLLSDQNVATMKAYNIVNERYSEGDDNYGIPYPGVVVINNQGKVTHKYFYEGYKNRVKFDMLYKQLK